MTKGLNGHAVDGAGNTVADPSLNVGALVEAEGRRQDDLRIAEARRQDDLRLAAKELADINNLHAKEIAVLRDAHSTAMAVKESGRVDSLRQGDREETTRATVAAQANISALANTTTTLADTLRNQVASTAAAAESRSSAYQGDVGKRLTAVELSLSEGKGKQQVSDPAMERLTVLVERLASAQQLGAGEKRVADPAMERLAKDVETVVATQRLAAGVKQGMSDGVKLIIAVLTVISLYLGFQTFEAPAQTPAPQVIYLPAPSAPTVPK